MKHWHIRARCVLSCLLLCIVPVLTAGCGKEVSELEKRADQTLCGVEYWYLSGMEWGADINIRISEEKIVYASYFPWEGTDGDCLSGETDPVTLENVTIEAEQWNNIEKAVMDIVPLLESMKEENRLKKLLYERLIKKHVMDGLEQTGFSLTWRDKDGEETKVQYYIPSDPRFKTVLDLLKETAPPIGREIVWYDSQQGDEP